MTKDKVIPEGFILQVTTWENDMDCLQAVELTGLTKGKLRQLLAVCELFKLDSEFANIYEYDPKIYKKLSRRLKSLGVDIENPDEDDEAVGLADCFDILALKLSYENEFWTRVVSDVQVFYSKEEVVFRNVSECFIESST